MPISSSDFEQIRKWAKQEAAIDLPPGKEFLVETRLNPVVDDNGFRNIASLVVDLMKAAPSTKLYKDCIDALTTHETSFFRGNRQYEFLKNKIFPDLLSMKLKNKRLAIWSGACSTGQELYTVAMILHKHFPEMLNWDLKLHGTDISENAIQAARKGEYGDLEIGRGLPEEYLNSFFTKTSEGNYQISDEIRNTVEFDCMNLVGRWPFLPPYHVIFMRNVLIYFDAPTKKKILERLKLYLHGGGILVLGSAETALDLDPDWKMVCEEGVTYYRLDDI